MELNDKIVIIGVTGYIGAWVAKKLTDMGYTQIVGTYRNEAKARQLQSMLPNVNFYKANLGETENWHEVLNGAKWVFNQGSAYNPNDRTFKDRGRTKEKGIRMLLQMAVDTGTVKKIVHTSAESTIAYANENADKTIFTEDDWTNEDREGLFDLHMVSKTMEEKAAWSFIHSPENTTNISLTTIHPTHVMGPSFVPWHNDMIYAMLHGDRAMADSQLYGVDVRDAAAMNIALMKSAAADGKRHFASAFKSTYSTLLDLIKKNFTDEQIEAVLGHVARIIPGADAADVLGPCHATSYYQDMVPRMLNRVVYKTNHPEAYAYEYTEPNTTVIQAMEKMLQDKNKG
ncbi:NAD-dependent epimerase/dehydratase family protein [Paenibacillus agri]|uniref:NAD-dependent epimerase/dehydratase family protein n=1 Tax=Paenibacillus agri TaxID=2744309 RepID=A0A850EVV0_9BACL|nr:NAD-dependent epimerase/dehydratase family protein [Paenibacillus agri]NUU64040.1 NAD-dependent epimerase/dehydratase family protein [Paenibacillus agri]